MAKKKLVGDVIEKGQEMFKGIMDIVDADEVAKGTDQIKKSAKSKVDEEQTQRQKVADAGKKAKKKKKDETPKQREARLKKIKKAKETEKETPKQAVLDEEKVIQRIGETKFASGAAEVITLGRQEAFDVINNLDRSGSQVPDRVLYGMAYISDEGIISNAKKGPKALESYLKKRENEFLKEFNQSPAMQKKYEAMAANNFNTVFEKLAREYTPVADPSDLMDRVIVGTMSDLTGTYDIAMINGIPVTLRHTGGTGFTSIIENVKKGVGWAADLGTMRKFSNRIAKVMDQTGKEVSVMPLDMSPGAVTFTSAIAQGLMQQIKATNAIQPSVKRAFDAAMRKDYPQWVGLDHPMAENQIAGIATDGLEEIGPGGRKFFDYMIASRQLQQLGFPDYFSTVRVLSKPGFMDRMLGSGQKIIKPKGVGDPIYAEAAKEMKKAGKGISETDVPNVPLLANLGIDNKTYNAGLAIEGFEKLASNVPAPILFRDAWKGMQGGLDEKGNPLTYAQKVNKLMTQHDLFQEVDEQWVESVTKFLQESAASNTRTSSGIILPGGQAGKVDPAMLLGMFGGSILAMGAAPSIVEAAPFIGPFSRVLKKEVFDKALEMEKAGASREEIWSSTFEMGQPMFKNTKDKMWRAEITAENATVDLTKVKPHISKTAEDLSVQWAKENGLIPNTKPSGFLSRSSLERAEDLAAIDKLSPGIKQQVKYNGIFLSNKLRSNPYATLGEILDFPELFEAYPQMKDFEVGQTLDRYLGGQYDESQERILLNMDRADSSIESTLMHEINHAVEGIEGWSRGGAPEQFSSKKKFKFNNKKSLANRMKVLKALEAKGYKYSDIKYKSKGVGDAPDTTGYEMRDGTFLTLNDMGINISQLDKQPIPFERDKWMLDDPELLQNLIDYEAFVGTKPSKRDEAYYRLVGEVQAKVVEARKDMSLKEMGAHPPFKARNPNGPPMDTPDMGWPEDKQIVSPWSGPQGFAASAGIAGTGIANADMSQSERRNQYPDGEPYIINADGSRSSHKMAAEVDENGNWSAFPTIVKMPDGTLKDFTEGLEEGTPEYGKAVREAEIYNSAIEGNIVDFGQDKEGALSYAEGGYKSEALKEYRGDDISFAGVDGLGSVVATEDVIDVSEKESGTIPGLAAATGVGGLQESPEDAVDDAIEEAAKPLSLGQQIQQNTDVAKVKQVVREIENIPMNNLQEAAQKFVKETVKDKVIQQKTNPQAASTDASIIGKMVRSDGKNDIIGHLEGVTGLPLRKIGEYVSDEVSEFVTGDKRFSALPSDIQGLEEANPFGGQTFTGDSYKDLKISYGLLFGSSPEDKIGVISGNDPGATFQYYTEAGELLPDGSPKDGSETVVVTPSRGPRKLLNSPGVSGADGADLLGEAVAYTPSVKALTAVNQGYKGLRTTRGIQGMGAGGQAAVLGAGSFATELGVDAALQGLGSEEGINPGDAAFTAATMAAFPLAGGAGMTAYKKAGEYVDPIQKALEPAIRALNTPLMTGSKAAGMNKLPR